MKLGLDINKLIEFITVWLMLPTDRKKAFAEEKAFLELDEQRAKIEALRKQSSRSQIDVESIPNRLPVLCLTQTEDRSHDERSIDS